MVESYLIYYIQIERSQACRAYLRSGCCLPGIVVVDGGGGRLLLLLLLLPVERLSYSRRQKYRYSLLLLLFIKSPHPPWVAVVLNN